ncbi:MAG TPA: 2-iminoacetate synthase ThiH [Kineosporiaceae bacterium]|nr:2-iminoacetate synthase ThiH [Kineosporiaceae bacterium]
MAEPPGASARQLDGLDAAQLLARALTATPADVAAVLHRERLGLGELAVLLSPAAAVHVEAMAQRARATTVQRFGRVVRLFAPLYLSNHCLSTCTYCGFARRLPIARSTLTPEQVEQEARVLAGQGFRHLLLVSGEHRGEVGPQYLLECLSRLHGLIPSLSVETQTWPAGVYAQLVAAGLEGVVHYQETYQRDRYQEVHPGGWKRDFNRRLNAVDAAGEAGARRLGLGVLLGLAADWRADVLALAAHARLVQQRYWRSEVTVSLPRITASAAGFRPVADIADAEFVQVVAALRLFLPSVGIVLSTREPASLRNGLVRIAITHLSAGSSTEPGGYTESGRSSAQFDVVDRRSPQAVAGMVAAAGYEPVFHDALPARCLSAPSPG